CAASTGGSRRIGFKSVSHKPRAVQALSDIQALAATLCKLSKPDMKPKELIAAVREQHPDAKKKEIVRAAFYALTQGVDSDAGRAERLHAFALAERANDEEDAPPPRKLRKKDRRKDRAAEPRVH
ncbi:hypothetical protein, partial [Methylobacterium oryzisoli]